MEFFIYAKNTALIYAAKNQNLDIVKRLLSCQNIDTSISNNILKKY